MHPHRNRPADADRDARRRHEPRHHRRHPHGPLFGPGGRARRGNLRAAILVLLTDEPMHGYQIIQRLEERSGGVWRPSPGSVYPTLQLLEDQGMVRGQDEEGRRVFALTDAGRAEAERARSTDGDPLDALGGASKEPRLQLRHAMHGLGAAVRQVAAAGTAEQVEETLGIIADARRRIYSLLAESE